MLLTSIATNDSHYYYGTILVVVPEVVMTEARTASRRTSFAGAAHQVNFEEHQHQGTACSQVMTYL